MAIISTITRELGNVIGDRRLNIGTYDSDASGEVNTGFETCEFLHIQGTATVGGAGPMVNASFPRGGTAIPILTNSIGGIWFALGR